LKQLFALPFRPSREFARLPRHYTRPACDGLACPLQRALQRPCGLAKRGGYALERVGRLWLWPRLRRGGRRGGWLWLRRRRPRQSTPSRPFYPFIHLVYRWHTPWLVFHILMKKCRGFRDFGVCCPRFRQENYSKEKFVFVKKLDGGGVEGLRVDYDLFVDQPRLSGGVVSALQRYVALRNTPHSKA